MDLVTIDSPSQSDSEAFEKQIAYFFGVEDDKPVSHAFINALNELAKAGSDKITPQVEHKALLHIEEAYRSIANQQKWSFDIEAAAKLELQIILGLSQGMSLEKVHELSAQLYLLIFKMDSPQIRKAVMLRTFLYFYKSQIEKSGELLSPADQILMLDLARASEKYLNGARNKGGL